MVTFVKLLSALRNFWVASVLYTDQRKCIDIVLKYRYKIFATVKVMNKHLCLAESETLCVSE